MTIVFSQVYHNMLRQGYVKVTRESGISEYILFVTQVDTQIDYIVITVWKVHMGSLRANHSISYSSAFSISVNWFSSSTEIKFKMMIFTMIGICSCLVF